MNKLTLPIEIGKKYGRRDGEVVLASRQIYDNLIIQADDSGELKDFVFQSNGAGTSNPKFSEKYFYDLVADYVEKDVNAGHKHATKMMDEAKRTEALIRGGEIRQLRARIAELEAENASLRDGNGSMLEALEIIANWPVTHPNNMDALAMKAIAKVGDKRIGGGNAD